MMLKGFGPGLIHDQLTASALGRGMAAATPDLVATQSTDAVRRLQARESAHVVTGRGSVSKVPGAGPRRRCADPAVRRHVLTVLPDSEVEIPVSRGEGESRFDDGRVSAETIVDNPGLPGNGDSRPPSWRVRLVVDPNRTFFSVASKKRHETDSPFPVDLSECVPQRIADMKVVQPDGQAPVPNRVQGNAVDFEIDKAPSRDAEVAFELLSFHIPCILPEPCGFRRSTPLSPWPAGHGFL